MLAVLQSCDKRRVTVWGHLVLLAERSVASGERVE